MRFHRSSEIRTLLKAQGDVLDRLTVLIDQADAEITHAGAVDDSAANDVPALVEREPFGNDIVHHHAPVVEEVHGFGAVDPPDGRRIGAGGQASVWYLTRAVDDGNGPEDDAISLLVQAIGEAKKLDIEIGRIESMPCEFLVANLHFVAVARNDHELVGEVLGIKGVPDVGAGKHGVGAGGIVDRFEKQPALEEAFGVRRLGGRGSRLEVRRDAARSIVRRSGGRELKRQYRQDGGCRDDNVAERFHHATDTSETQSIGLWWPSFRWNATGLPFRRGAPTRGQPTE